MTAPTIPDAAVQPDALADVFADDRRRCGDCYHLQREGNCNMALQGKLPGVPRWYLPDLNILQRCHKFCALPE